MLNRSSALVQDTLSAAPARRQASGRGVTNGLDVVAVRVENECGIVGRRITLAQTRLAVVPATGSERRSVERLDLLAVLGAKCEMCDRLLRRAGRSPDGR